jgi:transposase
MSQQPFNFLKVFSSGAAPVVNALCEVLRLPQIIDASVKWDSKQCNLSPGQIVKALVINTLTDRKPLYKVSEFYEKQDVELLFGPGVKAECFNDDALGRTLDRLSETDLQLLLSSIAVSANIAHEIPIKFVHSDTTSLSVYGDYEYDKNDTLNITFGFSKDHRPDLKQLMFGLGTTSAGTLLYGQVLDGNTSDKTWNNEMLDKIGHLLPGHTSKEMIYVADSALVTAANLHKLAEQQMLFISRLPESFTICNKVKERAWELNQWTQLGKLSDKNDAVTYQTCTFTENINKHKYRLVVVHSSALDARKEKAIDKKVENTKKLIEKEAKELAKQAFACEPDAQKAIQRFIKKHSNNLFDIKASIVAKTTAKHSGRGRPKVGETPEIETTYQVEVQEIAKIPKAIEKLKKLASTFVLITNLHDQGKYPDEEILREYKHQSTAEMSFKFLKSPLIIDAVYFKKPKRVDALCYIFLLALMVVSFLQYRVRKRLEEEEKPLTIPGKRKTYNPTARAILDLLNTVNVAKIVAANNDAMRLIAEPINPDALRVIELAGFNTDIYTTARH